MVRRARCFGKNAIGGTLRMISRNPPVTGGGYADQPRGSQSPRCAARFDVTLVPGSRIRPVQRLEQAGLGYFKVLDYECVNGAGPHWARGPGWDSGCGEAPDQAGDRQARPARWTRWVTKTCVRAAPCASCSRTRLEFNLIADITSQNQKGLPTNTPSLDGSNPAQSVGWSAVVASQICGRGIGLRRRFLTDSDFTNYSRYDDPLNHRAYPEHQRPHTGVCQARSSGS